jgi:hypothetical protein
MHERHCTPTELLGQTKANTTVPLVEKNGTVFRYVADSGLKFFKKLRHRITMSEKSGKSGADLTSGRYSLTDSLHFHDVKN